MTLAARILQRTSSPAERSIDRWNFGGSLDVDAATKAGQAVTPTTALNLVAVYSCVRLLAESVAALPVEAVRTEGDTRTPSAAPAWLTAPNPDMTGQELIEQCMASLTLQGNAYVYVVRSPSTGSPLELWPLHPDALRVERTQTGALVYTAQETGHRLTPVDSPSTGDLLHVRALTIPGSAVGLAPVDLARESIGLGLAAQEYGARWFSQGASPSGVIEVDGPLTEAGAKMLAKQWAEDHVGSMRAHLPGVLTNGAKYRPISVTPEQAQFLQTRQFQLTEIARLFRVPPHMLGAPSGETMTYANTEQWGTEFVTHSLRPWLVRLETAFSRLLPDGSNVRFRAEGLLRGDSKARADFYASGLSNGWLVPNEARRWEDLPPLDGGDVPRATPAPTASPRTP